MIDIKKLSVGVILLYCTSFMAGCAPSPLRIHADFIPASSLRLAQVMYIEKRAVILTDQAKPIYEALIASGIKDSEIVDGSVVAARIFCCGGISKELSSERAASILLFVPKPLSVSLGDIVEVRSGRSPEKSDAGLINTVTRIIEKDGEKDAKCWWDPKNDRLWLRVLYGDWMPGEGWVKQDGKYPAWYKPAAVSPSIK